MPDPSEFLPVAYRDIEELDGFLEHLAREVYDADLRALLDAFLGDEALPRRVPAGALHARRDTTPTSAASSSTRSRWPRSRFETCALHPRLELGPAPDRGDPPRRRQDAEFQLGAEIALSEAGALVGHVSLGQQLVAERARGLDGFPEAKLHALSHCILAHHGPDALPGRQFRSPEALALYRLNALDAGVKGALEHGLE